MADLPVAATAVDTSVNDAALAPLLDVRAVSRYFGGVHALDGVTMRVRAGTVHGLIGPNGAGKTTLINLLTGFSRPTAGEIVLWVEAGATASLSGRAVRLDGLAPHRVARLGVARTFQNIRLFGALSALDNVLVGRRHGAVRRSLGRLGFLPAALRAERDEQEGVLTLLARLGVAEARRPAGTLSYGDQRRVELARALATDPRLLLLDEPTAGMNRAETDRLGTTIRDLVLPDRAIVLIEHDLPLIMSVCDDVTVLNFGRVIAQGPPAAIAADPAVIDAYLGRDDDVAAL